MRPTSSLLCGCLAAFCLAVGVRTQAEASQEAGAGGRKPVATEPVDQEAALVARAEKAIADYEAARGNRKLRRQAGKLLQWLGETDHEIVEKYLSKQLKRTAPKDGAVGILDAIAGSPRPRLENRVWSVLHDEKASWRVRRSAAKALLAMGRRAHDRLAKMLRKGKEGAKEPVRLTVVSVLVGTKDSELIRRVVPVFSQGTSDDKVKFLRILDPVRDVTEIDTVRVKLITRGSLILGAIAWRQLAQSGHPRAADLAIDLLERMPEGPTPAVAAEMIPGIVRVRDEELYPLLLRYGAISNRAVKTALRKSAAAAAKDMALMRYMARRGLEHDSAQARDAAMLLLREAPAEAVAPLVERVRRKLRRPRREALDLAAGLHDVLARDPTWRKDLLKLAASNEPNVRAVGLTLLRELDADDAIAIAQKSLGSKLWELRAAAIRYLTSFRDVSSIPLLIARYGKEEGRLASELGNALFVHTGTRCFKKSEWKDWWREHRNGFTVPHPDTVRAGLGGVAGQTSAYFGIPLTSKHVAFCLDVSGSMGGRVEAFGTDTGRRRIDAAKKELAAAIGKMPAVNEVNLVTYNGAVRAQWPELRQLDEEHRKKVLGTVKKLRVGGGTNIFDALEVAFQDSKVDTIYLLSDGEPTSGAVTDPLEIADEVRRWNRLRQIVIHTIGFGIDTELLRRLAEESGGIYTFIK
ncbi:MAG: VWA domain-containing protein [bacterium]|nr:VWA domain-containing protein [bacterium]